VAVRRVALTDNLTASNVSEAVADCALPVTRSRRPGHASRLVPPLWLPGSAGSTLARHRGHASHARSGRTGGVHTHRVGWHCAAHVLRALRSRAARSAPVAEDARGAPSALGLRRARLRRLPAREGAGARGSSAVAGRIGVTPTRRSFIGSLRRARARDPGRVSTGMDVASCA
jgi:hypothetical protein